MTTVIHSRINQNTRARLAEHASDVGRTFSSEARLWLEVGSAMAFCAALLGPHAKTEFPDPAELDALRAQALAEVHRALARALPQTIAPNLIAEAFAPSM